MLLIKNYGIHNPERKPNIYRYLVIFTFTLCPWLERNMQKILCHFKKTSASQLFWHCHFKRCTKFYPGNAKGGGEESLSLSLFSSIQLPPSVQTDTSPWHMRPCNRAPSHGTASQDKCGGRGAMMQYAMTVNCIFLIFLSKYYDLWTAALLNR